MYKARNIAAQVEQCMQFYRGFGRSKWSPGENRKTQVYRGGIERINGFFEIDSEWFVGIKFSRNSNQTLRKVRIDSPISYHVGVGQCISCDDRAKSHAVKLGLLSTKTGLYISQALSISLRLSRYLSGSLDKSVEQKPCKETGRGRKTILSCGCPGIALRIGERWSVEYAAATAQTPVFHRSYLPPTDMFSAAWQKPLSRFKSRPEKYGFKTLPII